MSDVYSEKMLQWLRELSNSFLNLDDPYEGWRPSYSDGLVMRVEEISKLKDRLGAVKPENVYQQGLVHGLRVAELILKKLFTPRMQNDLLAEAMAENHQAYCLASFKVLCDLLEEHRKPGDVGPESILRRLLEEIASHRGGLRFAS